MDDAREIIARNQYERWRAESNGYRGFEFEPCWEAMQDRGVWYEEADAILAALAENELKVVARDQVFDEFLLDNPTEADGFNVSWAWETLWDAAP